MAVTSYWVKNPLNDRLGEVEMSGEEILGQRSQITGGEYERCDLCNQLFPATQLEQITNSARFGEFDETMRVCPTCQARIYSGELDVETMLSDDDDWHQ